MAYQFAFSLYLRKGKVPPEVVALVNATSSWDALEKYNPTWQNQPRVPAGDPNGGQWTDGGGGGGTQPEETPVKPWPPAGIEDIDDPPLEPVYPVETLIFGLTALSARGALAAIRVVIGVGRTVDASSKIQRAADAIEEYLGGKPDRAFPNEAGDMIIMKGDKKVRFDINNSGKDEPHFHIQKESKTGEWIDAGDQHRYYFSEGAE